MNNSLEDNKYLFPTMENLNSPILLTCFKVKRVKECREITYGLVKVKDFKTIANKRFVLLFWQENRML